MNSSNLFEARCFDGKAPIARAARVRFEPDGLLVETEGQRQRFARERVRVSRQHLGVTRFLNLPDGTELALELENGALLEGYPASPGELAWVSWLERRIWAVLSGVLVLFAVIGTIYGVLIPRAADVLAEQVGARYEKPISEAARRQLGPWVRDDASVSVAQRSQFEEEFKKLARSSKRASVYRLKFWHTEDPNAFAFPDGTIVVTDALVKRCSADGVVAVMAHEIGHIEERHALRHSLRAIALSSALSLITADLGSVSLAAARVPSVLAKTRYSREFEAEADAFAFQLLKAHGRSPADFASCLERLTPSSGSSEWTFLSTHPSSESRVAEARAAGHREPSAE